ncbi:MAG: flagellar basal body rod protein FlgB [Alphaproteobacteria bacterium]
MLDTSLMTVMKAKLKYHSARQAEIAQNVANVDTPGYKARDIAEPDFAKLVRGGSSARNLPMKVTSRGHIPGGGQIMAMKVEKRDKTYDLNPDENNVSVEEEMMHASTNQSEYNKVLLLYRKTADMLRIAIRPSGGQ